MKHPRRPVIDWVMKTHGVSFRNAWNGNARLEPATGTRRCPDGVYELCEQQPVLERRTWRDEDPGAEERKTVAQLAAGMGSVDARIRRPGEVDLSIFY